MFDCAEVWKLHFDSVDWKLQIESNVEGTIFEERQSLWRFINDWTVAVFRTICFYFEISRNFSLRINANDKSVEKENTGELYRSMNFSRSYLLWYLSVFLKGRKEKIKYFWWDKYALDEINIFPKERQKYVFTKNKNHKRISRNTRLDKSLS